MTEEQPASWFDEPVAQGRSPLRQRDTAAVVVSAVLLFCLTLLLIVGALASGGARDGTEPEPPGSAAPSGAVSPKD
ncbi:hypothetical protein [Jidongwangia harbinensis]|uniref:hypothetical protein n=1 Tax=Jidongwangia harbinensis TaxID=2878561 RepID=UPI001CDA0D5E|nr:hypothetical protein [Jidongwangia harbinensis]MCA2213323.1 hypothetical protein [Jidongwangia harbinensis]